MAKESMRSTDRDRVREKAVSDMSQMCGGH